MQWPDLSVELKDWRDDEVIAGVIYGEARNQLYGGQVAIACVIRNRASLGGWWGNSCRTVATAKWQFSCWADQLDKIKSGRERQTIAWTAALNIADSLVNGTIHNDPTMGSTMYYNPAGVSQAPNWAVGQTAVVQIGPHYFYRQSPSGKAF
jgi:spore germination cell wall hydrolase CwlJ-like protein